MRGGALGAHRHAGDVVHREADCVTMGWRPNVAGYRFAPVRSLVTQTRALGISLSATSQMQRLEFLGAAR